MKKAIANGATFWPSGDYYGMLNPLTGLAPLELYFNQYPEDAGKITILIKGCVDFQALGPKNKRNEVIASYEARVKLLGSTKKIDILGPACHDPSIPLQETQGARKTLADAGKISGVVTSEISATTIEKDNSVYPLSVVEVEFSLYSPDFLTNDVAMTAKKLDTPLITYPPLGRGFLTGEIRSVNDIPESDIRRYFDYFHPKNLELVDKLKALAAKQNATPAQLALAWIRSLSNSSQAGTIIPIPGEIAPSRVEENSKNISLAPEEKAELDKILNLFTIHGGRYNVMLEQLWASLRYGVRRKYK